MKIYDYYHKVFVPASAAISAMRVAGIPVDIERLENLQKTWTKNVVRLEKKVENFAASRGIRLNYSAKHAPEQSKLIELLYGTKGLGLDIQEYTDTGAPSTDDSALMHYASVSMPHEGDIEIVRDILKIRSYGKGIGTYLEGFRKWRRSDGAVHPKYNWARVRTSRISAQDPAVHQIPERSDMEIATGIKSCLVPRIKPAPDPGAWNPNIHGSCFRWDISGAEAAIRAAMLVYMFNKRPGVLWDYIRNGKDVHSLTASIVYGVPEGTYKKGSPERDKVGKQIFFAKLFGGSWRTIQRTVWQKARIALSEEEAKQRSELFDKGYPELPELYEGDIHRWAKKGYVQDGYGRRRVIPVPPKCTYRGFRKGWSIDSEDEIERSEIFRTLNNCFHTLANTPTQSMNATDTFWMIAMCYAGETVPLQVPEIWSEHGVLFPEAKNWTFHEGRGPGGKPFKAWQTNTVHDSDWGDCAPGYLEAVAKVIYRRCTAVPFDWRLRSDVPYRVELKVGPDQANLMDYNKVAKMFGLEPMPTYCQ